MHAAKSAVKDWFLPQSMFADLGLKYLGPIDGHNVDALRLALIRARDFRGPVLVHCVTQKGQGYPPAESDDAEQMHSPPAFDPTTGKPVAARTTTWTHVFGRELVVAGAERPDVVAITAAMSGPTGLVPFATAFPDRAFDVGIAEQHALTSAAGLAMGGMHPVVALYATFLNRAFDQLLMDCALHRLGVTVVLDRAGVTGEDGPSHHGMWDMSLAAIVPGLRLAAPRDAASLAEELAEALRVSDGPTMLRFPKGAVPPAVPAVRRFRATLVASHDFSGTGSSIASGSAITAGVDILAEPPVGQDRDVLLVAVGSFRRTGGRGGLPVGRPGHRSHRRRPALGVAGAARNRRSRRRSSIGRHRRGRRSLRRGRRGRHRSVGRDRCSRPGPRHSAAVPRAGTRAELLADLGLSAQAVARGITEEIARSSQDVRSSPHVGPSDRRLAGDRDPGAAG